MSKTKSTFFCRNCGYESAKWLGKCPSCNQWNTFQEERVSKTSNKTADQWTSDPKGGKKPVRIVDVNSEEGKRIGSGDPEFDRVLGGGIVPGSVVLIGGEPGIGKSTLLLQIGLQLTGKKVFYVSGEESDRQIKLRADRLNGTSSQHDNFYISSETETTDIFNQIRELRPDLLVIDSIQTLQSGLVDSLPGTVSQIRQCTGEMIRYAKETGTPVFLIGHITKEGTIAGPKLLEHMVDTVLQFEGDQQLVYRLLRTIKNRFGSTSELGIYQMSSGGLNPIENPSEILISGDDQDLSGVSIGATIEGNRPLLIEAQALVSPASYGNPQRSTTGFDGRRLNMLLAVLEKRVGLKYGLQDVFLNIAGGLRITDPAIDLSVCAALMSSYTDQVLPGGICFAAEVGLGGELRGVANIERRISEAAKLGFRQIVIAKKSPGNLTSQTDIDVVKVGRVRDLHANLFNG